MTLKQTLLALAPRPLHPIFEKVGGNLYATRRASIHFLMCAGWRYCCPCCKGHFRRLLPHGVIPRPNARCPRCGALERHRLIWLYLEHRTNLYTDHLRVLHLAPEPVLQRKLRSMPNLDYISADLCSPNVQIKFDICRIPFSDNTFDVILCSHVLKHIPDDRQAMAELFRVMKSAGWGILQVPLDVDREHTFEDENVVSPEEREHMFGQHDHVRVYGRDYYDRLRSVGFTVWLDPYGKELPRDLVEKYVLPKETAICRCIKPNSRNG